MVQLPHPTPLKQATRQRAFSHQQHSASSDHTHTHTHTHSQTPHTHTQPQTLIYTVIPWEWLKLRFLCLLLKKSTAPMETQLVWESIPYLHKSGECQIIPSGCDCGLPIVFCLSSIVRGHVPGMAIDTTEARTLKQKVSFLFVHL